MHTTICSLMLTVTWNVLSLIKFDFQIIGIITEHKIGDLISLPNVANSD